MIYQAFPGLEINCLNKINKCHKSDHVPGNKPFYLQYLHSVCSVIHHKGPAWAICYMINGKKLPGLNICSHRFQSPSLSIRSSLLFAYFSLSSFNLQRAYVWTEEATDVRKSLRIWTHTTGWVLRNWLNRTMHTGWVTCARLELMDLGRQRSHSVSFVSPKQRQRGWRYHRCTIWKATRIWFLWRFSLTWTSLQDGIFRFVFGPYCLKIFYIFVIIICIVSYVIFISISSNIWVELIYASSCLFIVWVLSLNLVLVSCFCSSVLSDRRTLPLLCGKTEISAPGHSRHGPVREP